jgi:hypothetical protein
LEERGVYHKAASSACKELIAAALRIQMEVVKENSSRPFCKPSRLKTSTTNVQQYKHYCYAVSGKLRDSQIQDGPACTRYDPWSAHLVQTWCRLCRQKCASGALCTFTRVCKSAKILHAHFAPSMVASAGETDWDWLRHSLPKTASHSIL